MKTISQRQLRNDNAEVIRGVESGETYTVTRNGVPVARLVPLTTTGPGLPVSRPARTRGAWGELRTHRVSEPSRDTLAQLREERA